jgi:pseudouridine synthase
MTDLGAAAAAASQAEARQPKPSVKTLQRLLLDLYGVRPLSLDASLAAKLMLEPPPGHMRLVLSRDSALALIEGGAVTVDGAIVRDPSTPVVDVTTTALVSKIAIDSAAIENLRAQIRVFALNKPVGVDCNCVETDPSSIVHIIDKFFPRDQKPQQQQRRPFCIGRLDKDSHGLLLLTTCGAVCERSLHSDFDHSKRYRVRIARTEPIPAAFWEKMRAGVTLSPTETTRPCVVTPAGPSEFTIVLCEGLNRQIRRSVEVVGRQCMLAETAAKGSHPLSNQQSGYVVTSLRREACGPIALDEDLGGLAEGAMVELHGALKERFLDSVFAPPKSQQQLVRSAAAAAAAGQQERRRDRRDVGDDDS